jgi:hypothetical protein
MLTDEEKAVVKIAMQRIEASNEMWICNALTSVNAAIGSILRNNVREFYRPYILLSNLWAFESGGGVGGAGYLGSDEEDRQVRLTMLELFLELDGEIV